MSYDLMVFKAEAAPRDRQSFMKWYEDQTEWKEKHGYNDPAVTSSELRAWMKDMAEVFPVLDTSGADKSGGRFAEYIIGCKVIYISFLWTYAEDAYYFVKKLAEKNGVGFFDVSADEGDVIFPSMTMIVQ